MAKYNKSWGSVSTNFTKTQAPSSAARMSKAAEDKYQKDMAQLRSMKEVASFDSQQARKSAAMADKAATYELNALTKFSSTLDNFIRTDVAEWNAEREAQDLREKIESYQKTDGKDVEEWENRQKELEDKIAGISENNAEKQKLEKALEDHNLTSPNDVDPTKLSGNEKLAYFAVKGKSIIDNAEVSYENWVRDQGPNEIEITWEDKIDHVTEEGVKTKRFEKKKISELNTPREKRELKKMFLASVVDADENKMGGLKPEWRTLILAGPLANKLEAIQVAETQQYNTEQRNLRIKATEQTIFNWQTGVAGYTPQEGETAQGNREKHVNNLLQTWRNDGVKARNGTAGNQLSRFSTQLIDNVTSETDAAKIESSWQNTKDLLATKVTEGPNKGKTLQQVLEEQSGYDHQAAIAKVQAAMADREERLDKEEEAQITEEKLTLMNQLVSDRNSGKISVDEAKARIAEWENDLIDPEKGGYTRPAARIAIFAKMTDPAIEGALKDSAAWEESCKDLQIRFNGVIPLSEVGFMPDSLRKELEEKYNWRFVRKIPGTENKDMVDLTAININTLKKALRQSEVDAGQKKPNGDSIVMDDLANDMYHSLLQKYTLDDKLTPRKAATQALLEVEQMIVNGRSTEGKYLKDGRPNPFYSEPGLWTGAWGKSKAMKRHQGNYLRLPSYVEQQRLTFDEKHSEAVKDGKVNYKESYMFTPVVINHNTDAGKEGHVNLGSIQHLGLSNDVAPSKIMIDLARKAGMSPAEFRRKQRHAAIESTGGYLNSPLMKDPTLIKAWGLESATFQDEVKAAKGAIRKKGLEDIQSKGAYAGLGMAF